MTKHNKIINNFMINFSLIFLIIFNVKHVLAKDYIIPKTGRLAAVISTVGSNRISVENDRIAEVYGNEAEYLLDSHSDLGHILIVPYAKPDEHINITIITEQKKIIDLKLTVKEIDPQILILKSKEKKNYVETSYLKSSSGEQTIKDKAIKIIKAARAEQGDFTRLANLSCVVVHPNVQFLNGMQNFIDGHLVVKANIKNITGKELELNEQEFKNCIAKITAVAFDQTSLPVGGVTTMYLVGEDD